MWEALVLTSTDVSSKPSHDTLCELNLKKKLRQPQYIYPSKSHLCLHSTFQGFPAETRWYLCYHTGQTYRKDCCNRVRVSLDIKAADKSFVNPSG